jgi:hypothetical protein
MMPPREPVGVSRVTPVRRTFLLLMVAAAICGCRPSPTVPAAGRLTSRGEPLAGVSVQFVPLAGGRPSTGFTDADGRFQLRYTKDVVGVVPGRHAVTLDWYPASEGEVAGPGIAAAIKRHGPAGTPLEVDVPMATSDLQIAVD